MPFDEILVSLLGGVETIADATVQFRIGDGRSVGGKFLVLANPTIYLRGGGVIVGFDLLKLLFDRVICADGGNGNTGRLGNEIAQGRRLVGCDEGAQDAN
jgi:hypothetical protein